MTKKPLKSPPASKAKKAQKVSVSELELGDVMKALERMEALCGDIRGILSLLPGDTVFKVPASWKKRDDPDPPGGGRPLLKGCDPDGGPKYRIPRDFYRDPVRDVVQSIEDEAPTLNRAALAERRARRPK